MLIELQKWKLATDVDRFRAYLAEEYRRLCEISDVDGSVQRQGLPIITIYFGAMSFSVGKFHYWRLFHADATSYQFTLPAINCREEVTVTQNKRL